MADLFETELPENINLTWKSTRFQIGLLLMFGMFCGTSMRINLSMGIVCMVNVTNFDFINNVTIISEISVSNFTVLCPNSLNSHSEFAHEQFPNMLFWTSNQVSMLLSAVFYGSLFSCWWSGLIADKFGPKIILLIAISIIIFLTFLTPLIAEFNFYAIFIIRFIMGICEVCSF